MGRLKHPRYLLFLTILLLTSPALTLVLPLAEALVTGFDVATFAFVLSCISLWRGGDPDRMRIEAKRDDANQLLLLLLSAVISVVVLVALATLILDRDKLGAGDIALLVATLACSWTFTNLVLTFHYARIYYAAHHGGDSKGVDFPGDEEPDFSDFVNFAFVIGMTCQTADIAITGRKIRRVATFHGVFAFAFNLGIMALTVNVLASSAG